MSVHDLSPRLGAIAAWLQREDDELLYTPDMEDVPHCGVAIVHRETQAVLLAMTDSEEPWTHADRVYLPCDVLTMTASPSGSAVHWLLTIHPRTGGLLHALTQYAFALFPTLAPWQAYVCEVVGEDATGWWHLVHPILAVVAEGDGIRVTLGEAWGS